MRKLSQETFSAGAGGGVGPGGSLQTSRARRGALPALLQLDVYEIGICMSRPNLEGGFLFA